MSSALAPFRFLDLPYDIRERVYTILLANDANEDALAYYKLTDSRDLLPSSLPFNTSIILMQRSPPSITTSGLLLTNHRLHSELVSTIRTLSLNPTAPGMMKYILDIAMSSSLIYPTWLSLPTPTRYTSGVHVYLRLLSSQPDFFRHRWWGYNGPSPLTQGLLQLLSDFLVYGPTFRPSTDNTDVSGLSKRRRIFIDDLTIEFVRPSSPSSLPISLESSKRRDVKQGSEEWNCLEVMSLLGKVACSGQLHGRVKVVRFVVGDEVKEWRIDEYQVANDEKLETARKWAAHGWKSMSDATKNGDYALYMSS